MPSPLDRFLPAFRRQLARAPALHPDHCARLYWDDREAFVGALHGSWATGRPEPFVSLAKGAAANEGLSVKLANRLSMRLTQAGRWSEAAEILHDPRYRLLDTAAGQMQLAQVSLGLGRLREAATAAVTARERGASYESVAREIETQVGRMRTLQAAVSSRR